MLSNTEKEKKINEIQKYLYLLQFDYNVTQSEIAELLNNNSNGKLKLNKGDISKIQSNKVKFSRSLDKLQLILEILKKEIQKVKSLELNNEINIEPTNQLNVPNEFFNIVYDKDENIQFNLFPFFVDKVLPNKYRLILVFLFFILLSPVVITIWAFNTGVWNGIDYPLSESYSTWIGEFVLAIINVLILSYYRELSYLMQFSCKYQKLAGNYKWQMFVLILSFGFSWYFHHNFTTDQLFGWCEKSSGILSKLGYYHLMVFTIQIWIIMNLIINIYFTGKVINDIGEYQPFKQNGLLMYKKGVVKKLSNIIIIYVKILLISGIYVLTFLYTIYRFIEKREMSMIPIDTGLIELIGYVSIYLVFGIGFFWFSIIKPIINLLESNKKDLIQEYPNNNIISSLNILPYNENPFKYVFLSFLAILSIVVISIISIILINRILNTEIFIV
ncbi:MAG: hypothetical protein ABFS35_10560 [Bacteroidota bacterium]